MQGFTNIIFPPASFQIPSGHCSKGRRGREEVKANNNQKKKDKKTKILEPDSTILIRANRFQEREELKQRGENGGGKKKKRHRQHRIKMKEKSVEIQGKSKSALKTFQNITVYLSCYVAEVEYSRLVKNLTQWVCPC